MSIHPDAPRIEQSNEVAAIIIAAHALHFGAREGYVPLDLRYSIADTLWAAGYRKVAQPLVERGGTVYGIRPHRPMSIKDREAAKRLAELATNTITTPEKTRSMLGPSDHPDCAACGHPEAEHHTTGCIRGITSHQNHARCTCKAYTIGAETDDLP